MPDQRVAVLTCLRYATQPSQGIGWSVYNGPHWVNPQADVGTITIKDNNSVPRSLVFDRVDNFPYELATTERVTEARPAYVDKEGVQDAEIPTAKWTREETVSPLEKHKKLEDGMSHLYVREQFPEERGETGHTASGLRTAQAFQLDALVDGEQITPTAEATDIPETGDITFSGSKVQARRIQYVLRSATSEFQWVGRQHEMVSKEEMGTRDDRMLGEHDAQLELASNLAYWLSRGPELSTDRVSGVQLSGVFTPTTGPDGLFSAFQIAVDTNLQNPAVAGVYTQLLWSTVLHGGYTQYSDNVNGWLMQTRTGVGGLPASMVLPAGSYFDFRIFSSAIAAASLAVYYNNVVRQAGRGFLPIG